MDKTIGFIVFTSISALVAVCFGIWSWYRYKYQREKGKILSTVHLLTLGIFAATVLFFVPVYYCYYFDSGNRTQMYGMVKPFLLAVHNAFRLFILDGDFDIILNSLSDEPSLVQFCCSGYALALYVIAPVMTFSNVLSLFKHLWDGFRYRITRKKNLYVFSELNARSLLLAKDICKRGKNGEKEIQNPLIVFCGVHERVEEDNAELLTKARELHAVCLKNDVTSLDIQSKKRSVELFIMGDNEAENVSKAAKISGDLNKENKKRNIKVFVFNQSEGAGHVIDSLKYDNLLTDPPSDKTSSLGKLCKKEKQTENEKVGYTFKLRRVDEKQQLVWNTLPEMGIFGLYENGKKDLHVLIAGLGIYGMEFFKTILWFAQLEGHRLYITIADKRSRAEIVSIINRQCPDILKTSGIDALGEAHYDVEIIDGVDVSQWDLANIMLHEDNGYSDVLSPLKKRLFETDIAIVALGEDNQNIESAVHLRTVFERVKEIKLSQKKKAADIQIYSVVYDELISSNLYNGDNSKKNSDFLINHKGTPYNIHFIGSLKERFTYKNVHDSAIEESAYRHHTGWVDVGQRIYDKWEAENKTELLKECFQNGRPECDPDEQKKKFAKFEYFRKSSIARELYVRELDKNTNLKAEITCTINAENPPADCLCESCARRKRSEHMRWNAYMRTCGFSYYKGKKNELALLHNDLRNWYELNEYEQCKD